MIYIVLFLISFILTYFIKEYAIKKSLVAHVNERSSHTVATPHGGGIAIALTWFAGLSYCFFMQLIDSQLFFALIAGTIIALVSFFDDIYDLSPKLRILTQSLTALLGLYYLGGFESLNLFFFEVQNPFVTNIFAFLLIVWFINLYNFLDGINGYAGSEAVFLALSGFILFGGEHFLVLAVSVLGFLFWNYNNAKIFMGDVGSTLLGYNVAIFTLYYANIESDNLWIWVVLFGVFWFDATMTLIRRKINEEKLSQPHKKHAYQRLTQAGWSHFKVTNFMLFLNGLFFLFVWLSPNIAISFLLSLSFLLGIYVFVERKKRFQ